MKKNNDKTNVMRILDQKKIQYESHCYADTEAISGMEVAVVKLDTRFRCHLRS